MDEDTSPQNKIGTSEIPKVGFGGIYAPESGIQDTTEEQPTARERAESLAQTAEQSAAGVKKAADAATKASTGNVIGAGADALKAGKSFKDSTKGKSTNKKQKAFISGLKKSAPIIVPIAVIALLIPAITALMPVHTLENIKTNLNSLFASLSTAKQTSHEAMLDSSSSSGYKVTDPNACAELALQEIIYPGCPEAEQDEDIQAYYRQKKLEDAVFAATEVPDSSDPSAYGGVFKWTDREGTVHMIDYASFDEYFNHNIEFNNAITRGATAWTGAFSSWFDDMALELTEKLDITRNDFQGYYEDINDQVGSAEAYKKIITEINDPNKHHTMHHTDNERLIVRKTCKKNNYNEKGLARRMELDDQDGTFLTVTNRNYVNNCTDSSVSESACEDSWDYYPYNRPVFDEFGNYTGCELSIIVHYDTLTYTVVDAAMDEASQKIESYLPEMSKSFKTISDDSTCVQLYGVSYFSIIVAASRLNQATTFAAQALENVEKMKFGLGHESGIHQLSKQLTGTGTYTYLDDDEGSGIFSSGYVNTSSTNRPALNSEGLSWLNTNSKIDLANQSVRKLSVEGVVKGFVINSGMVAACNATTITGNILYSLISFITGPFFHNQSHSNFDANDEAMLELDGRTLIDQAIRQAAYALVFNPCTTDAEGNLAMNEDVGNCIALGAHNYIAQNHRLAGGSPADLPKLKQFVEKYRHVIGKEVERDRTSRSPFDASSPNTFLGSIINQLTPHVASLTGSSLFTSIGSLVGNAIGSLLPSASALEEDTMLGNIGNCKLLDELDPKNSQGAVGDAFCVPYIINDVALFDPDLERMSAQEVENTVADITDREGNKNFDGTTEQGYRKINPSSNLARYIKYCSYRVSIFGVIDANILKDYLDDTKPGFFQSIFDALKHFVLNGFYKQLPIEEDRLDEALRWSTGRNCVATDNPSINNNFWNTEGRYYQAYMTYMRINANRYYGTGNNALAPINQYQEDHPIDTVEDLEAAQVGMLPEDYSAVKNYLAYYITDKTTFGPTIASADISETHSIFRKSITPLTNFIIETILPINQPPLSNPKTQGITA